jgi:hypothetical protein
MKVVINTCYGGFSLSRKALHMLRSLGHPLAWSETDIGEDWGDGTIRVGSMSSFLVGIPRDDTSLVEVVEALRKEANGPSAYLKVVEIPDDIDWYVQEYDGEEWVVEAHRKWR